MNVHTAYRNVNTHEHHKCKTFSNCFLLVFSYFLNSLIFGSYFARAIFTVWITICSDTVYLENNLKYFCFEIPQLSGTRFPDLRYVVVGSYAVPRSIIPYASTTCLNSYSFFTVY